MDCTLAFSRLTIYQSLSLTHSPSLSPLESQEDFKYLGLKFALNYRWNECSTYCLKTWKRAYLHFKTHVMLEGLKLGHSKKYQFETFVSPMLLKLKHMMLVSLCPLGKSLKMFKSVFLQSYSKLSNKHHMCSYFLRLDHSPLRSWA